MTDAHERRHLSRERWVFYGFLAAAGLLLATEHRAHLLSNVLIVAGFFLLAAAWKVLYQAQRRHALATAGPYARIRHPQYAGFVMIMLGFLLQWPTMVTLAMFPVLVFMYARLARIEEKEARAAFGEEYERYAARVPAFFPLRWP